MMHAFLSYNSLHCAVDRSRAPIITDADFFLVSKEKHSHRKVISFRVYFKTERCLFIIRTRKHPLRGCILAPPEGLSDPELTRDTSEVCFWMLRDLKSEYQPFSAFMAFLTFICLKGQIQIDYSMLRYTYLGSALPKTVVCRA